MKSVAAWPLLLVAGAALIMGGWRYSIINDADSAWIVAVGLMLIGSWAALEVQRLSGLRRAQEPWPKDDGTGSDAS